MCVCTGEGSDIRTGFRRMVRIGGGGNWFVIMIKCDFLLEILELFLLPDIWLILCMATDLFRYWA
jgi:hypothetical protein